MKHKQKKRAYKSGLLPKSTVSHFEVRYVLNFACTNITTFNDLVGASFYDFLEQTGVPCTSSKGQLALNDYFLSPAKSVKREVDDILGPESPLLISRFRVASW